jgi:hypothetical protein
MTDRKLWQVTVRRTFPSEMTQHEVEQLTAAKLELDWKEETARAQEANTCDRKDCATTRAALYDARQRLLLFERFLGQVETRRHTYDELVDVGRALLKGDRSLLENMEWRPVESAGD